MEGLTQTWSLCTEMSFYVVLPLLGALAVGRGGPRSLEAAWRRQKVLLLALVLVAVLFLGVRAWTEALPYQVGWWLPAYLDWFAGGMLLAVVEVRRRLPRPPRTVALLDRVGREGRTCLVVAGALFAISVTPVGGAYDFTPTAPWETMFKQRSTSAQRSAPAPARGDARVHAVASRPCDGSPRAWGSSRTASSCGTWSCCASLMPAMGIPFFSGQTLWVAVIVVLVTIGVASITYRLWNVPRSCGLIDADGSGCRCAPRHESTRAPSRPR